MPLEKHELLKSKKMTNLSFERNILIMTSAKQFLLMNLCLELEKLSKETGEKQGKAWNFIYKHKKVSTLTGISKEWKKNKYSAFYWKYD